jgi:hypothetical protein
MEEQVRIVLRVGPAGVRPGIPGGPDVWEVVAVYRSFGGIERTARWLDQPASAIATALRYYERHREEIDDWIRGNELAGDAAQPGGRSTR